MMPEGPDGTTSWAASAAATWQPSDRFRSGAAGGRGWNTYIWVDDADEAAAKARDAGGAVVMEPFDVMDAGRMAVLADPEGARSALAAEGHKGAKVVNEHGSLNFNGLATRDLERRRGVLRRGVRLEDARRWPAASDVDAARLRRPPRGDAPRASASRWPRWARPTGSSMSSPASTRSPTVTPTTPAHWSVTFGVDDVEATAAKAKELGGEVVSGPFDAPWAMTVIQGSPGSDVHRQPVRAGEQRSRQSGLT